MAARTRTGKLRAALRVALLLAPLVAPLRAAGQQLPPDDDWLQIETARFRVTYPVRLEPLARRAGARAERAYDELAGVLPSDPGGRIEIVLTDHTDFSNGFATIAPRKRIVVYARPPVDVFGLDYFDDWMELVVTHELTHIFHLDYTSRVGRFLRTVFGRPATTWPFFPEQAEPKWVIEGLAVYYETALTNSGRGEGTYHDMALRTAALEGRFETIDRTSGDSPVWPAGERVYMYGSGFFEWLLARRGSEKVGAFIRAIGGEWIPYRLNAAAKKAFGASFSNEWKVWSGEVAARADSLRTELARRAPLTRTEALTRDARWVIDPSISPDGTRLAFTRADGLTDAELRVAAPDGSGSRKLARLNDAGFFSWMPDGSLVTAELEFSDPYRLRSDLYRVAPDGTRTRLTHDARLDHPVALRDGRTVLAIQNSDGATDLVRVDLESGAVTPIIARETDVLWAFPAPSPDGRWIAAARWRRALGFDLVLLERDGGGAAGGGGAVGATWRVARQLTDDRAVESSPTWSPDGKWLVWSSDRSGIMNLYAASVDAAGQVSPIHQVTNLLTGIAYPSVDPAGRWLYGAVYHSKGWEVERLPFDPATWFEPLPLARVYAPVAAEPLPPPGDSPAHPYSAAKTIGPKYWEPYVWAGQDVFVPARGTLHVLQPFFGFATAGYDVVGRHAWSVAAGVSPSDANLVGTIGYSYAGLGNPVLSLVADQDWDGYGPLLGKRTTGQVDSLFVRERDRTLQFGSSFALRRIRYGGSLGLSAALVSEDLELLDRDLNAQTTFKLDAAHTHMGDLRASAALSTAHAQALSISTEEGALISVQGRVRRHLGLGDSLKTRVGFDRSFSEGTLRLRFYQPLRGLGLSRHVFALRGSAGAAAGPGADRFHFDAGGASGSVESVTGLGLFGGSSYAFPVRGYENGERTGRIAWSASAEYRFPIVRINRGVGLIPIHVDQVSGALFGDAGNAWGPTLGGSNQRYDNPRRATLWSAGAEFSADILTFWSIPLPVRGGIAFPGVNATGRGTSPVLYLRVGGSF